MIGKKMNKNVIIISLLILSGGIGMNAQTTPPDSKRHSLFFISTFAHKFLFLSNLSVCIGRPCDFAYTFRIMQ